MQQPQPALNISVSPFSDWQKWDDYADKNGGNLYHDSRWSLLIQQALGHESYYLCAERSDTVVGILPLVRVKHCIFSDYLVSLPFLNYGGVLADTPSIAASLLGHAAELAQSVGCSHIETLHTDVATLEGVGVISLSQSFDAESQIIEYTVHA